MSRVFILSPARLDGKRAQMLIVPRTPFAVASALRTREGAPIGDVFRFLSGLYFRGKLAYAQRFAAPPTDAPWLGSGVLVITTNRGLVPAETRICIEHLEAFSQTDLHHDENAFRGPLERDCRELARALGERDEAVLLGSIATKKYVEPLVSILGDKLFFPPAFVGKGDMSRGSMLLRAAEGGTELLYTKVIGAERHRAKSTT